jgi:cytoskeletal protein CcmA (bactofilin family)
MRKFLITCIVLFLTPLISSAEEVSFTTTRGNIYAAGATIDITEHAPNDIVAAGGHVIITGSAGNGLLAAGGSVVMSGKITGDARVAGGNITIADNIGGEAVIAAGKLHLLPKARIGSELIAAAGEIALDGTVGGPARIVGGTVFINGTINSDVDIKAQELIIGEHAVIKGNLRYEAPEEARIEQGAVITGQKAFTHKEIAPPGKTFVKVAGLLWILKVIATMAAALVLYFLLRDKTLEITALALDRFGNELLRGFIVLIIIPAMVLLLFVTVIGWLLGMLGLFFYIAFVVLSSVLGALVFTRWSSGYVFKKETAFSWPVIVLGVLIYQVIGLIPLFGWIVKFVFFLAALGAVTHLLYLRLKTGQVVQ